MGDDPFKHGFTPPGPVVCGIRLDVVAWTEETATYIDRFDPISRCHSLVEDGLAEIVTDFRQDVDGLTRILILDRGLTPIRLGALAQRLLEIETYRTLALLGIPLVRARGPHLRNVEMRLAAITDEMRNSTRRNSETLLSELTDLSAELEADMASSLYRFGASRAYYEIVEERLAALGETVVITAAAPLQILIRSDDNRVERDLWNLTAELNYDLGFATLTVLPAYRNMTIQSTSYEGGIKLRYDEKSKQTSLETRLANDDGRLKWLVGAFYFDNDRDVYNMIDSNPVSQRALQVFPNIGSKSYAFFGDTTFSLSDSFRLLGGIRYTHEVKTVQGVRTDLDANPTNNFVLDNRRVFKEVTWRAGAELDVGPSSMAYATVATGFKSGGFYTAVSPGNEFEPEHITAYTVGVRNRFLDNRLQLNIEGFYWKYKDNQQSAIGFDGFGNIAFVTRNAGDARLFGVSADIAARLSDNDNLSLNLEYNNSKFNRFTYEVPSFFNPANTGCSVGASTTPGRSRVDCSGFPLPRAPRFTAQAGYSHDFVFDSGAKLSLSLSGQYITSKYLTVDYQQVGKVGDTFTGDIDLTFTPASERFSISGFVNNVTNEEVYTGGAQHQQIARVFYGNINPPRTYGVRARVNF